MGYFLPDPRWEQPALLNARKAPNGRYTIDYSNSLAKDLAAVYIPGQYYNPVTDTPYEIYSTSTFPAFSNGASEADGTSVLWSDLPGPPGSIEWTIYARVSASQTGAGTLFGAGTDQSAAERSFYIYFSIDRIRYFVAGVGGESQIINTNFVVTDGEFYDICFTTRSAADHEGWLKDVDTSINNYTSATDITVRAIENVTNKVNVFANTTSGIAYKISPSPCEIECGFIWFRGFQDKDYKQMVTNPYQFLIPV